MIALTLALMLALGVGTVQVADSARPGDKLFGVDQAVENMRLKLAGEEKKNELRVRFAQERVGELKSLLEDESEDADDSADSENSEEAEGSEAETGNKEKEELSAEVQARVNTGLEAALNLIAGVEESEDAEVAGVVSELNSYLTALPANAKIEISDDKIQIDFEEEGVGDVKVRQNENSGKTKIEIKTEDGKVKLEVEGEEVKIKTNLDEGENKKVDDEDGKDDDEDDDGDQDDDEDSDDDKDDEDDDEDKGDDEEKSSDGDESRSGSNSGRD